MEKQINLNCTLSFKKIYWSWVTRYSVGLVFKPCPTKPYSAKKNVEQIGKQIVEIKTYNTLYIVNRDTCSSPWAFPITEGSTLHVLIINICSVIILFLGNTSVHIVLMTFE